MSNTIALSIELNEAAFAALRVAPIAAIIISTMIPA